MDALAGEDFGSSASSIILIELNRLPKFVFTEFSDSEACDG